MTVIKRRRNTPQRKTILAELRALQTHPTATDLYAVVRGRLPRISLGTIYRNLEVLHEDGHIRKIEFAGADTRYDGRLEAHDHIRCTDCGTLRDIPRAEPRPRPLPPNTAGYAVTGCRLEYEGICPDCRGHR